MTGADWVLVAVLVGGVFLLPKYRGEVMPGKVDYTHANIEFLPAGYKYGFLFQRVYLGAYYPGFLEPLLDAKAKAAERGFHFWSEYGYRPWIEQHKLRLLFLEGKGGRAAPAGDSAHQYGIADDSTLDTDPTIPGLQPSWDPKKYEVLGEELTRAGLVWGASFGDRPHANLKGYSSAGQLAPLKKAWNSAPAGTPDDMRLRSIWQYLDALKEK